MGDRNLEIIALFKTMLKRIIIIYFVGVSKRSESLCREKQGGGVRWGGGVRV